MKKQLRKYYTFKEVHEESMRDPEFRQAWEESEVEYNLAVKLIEIRLKLQMSQRDLAKKIHTSQAAISRIEAMNGNPSVGLLKRIATALGTKLTISFS